MNPGTVEQPNFHSRVVGVVGGLIGAGALAGALGALYVGALAPSPASADTGPTSTTAPIESTTTAPTSLPAETTTTLPVLSEVTAKVFHASCQQPFVKVEVTNDSPVSVEIEDDELPIVNGVNSAPASVELDPGQQDNFQSANLAPGQGLEADLRVVAPNGDEESLYNTQSPQYAGPCNTTTTTTKVPVPSTTVPARTTTTVHNGRTTTTIKKAPVTPTTVRLSHGTAITAPFAMPATLAPGEKLANTGDDTTMPLAVALGLLLSGAAAVGLSSRRRETVPEMDEGVVAQRRATVAPAQIAGALVAGIPPTSKVEKLR